MIQIKQSFSWGSFVKSGIAPNEFLRGALEIGIEGVELVPQELWSSIKELGLRLITANGHRSIQEGLNRREYHQRIEQEILANITLAEKWEIPNLIVFSGNRYGRDDQESAEITAEGLQRVARTAQDAGVRLILELLNSKINHKDYQADHVTWGISVCQMINSPAVRLLYDIYHMQIMEGDLIRTIQEHHNYFAHYHTAGNPGRQNIDDTQEIQYLPIIRAIHATGYTGYIGHEFAPKGDPLQALQYAYTLCKRGAV